MATKVTFCGCNSLIIVNCGITALCAQIDLYSDWKEDVQDSTLFPGFSNVFDSAGGDPISATQSISAYFFLANGWRIRPFEGSHTLLVCGNIFTVGGICSPFVNTLGCFNVRIETNVSSKSITETVAVCGGCAADIANAVWDELLVCHVIGGSAGKKLGDLPTSGTADWTACERENIRAALGVDGCKTNGSCGLIQCLDTKIDTIDMVVDTICINVLALPSAATISDTVWDEILACHVISGSTGEALTNADCAACFDNIPTKQQIAKEVWKTELPGCFDVGSAGQRLSDASDCIDALLGTIATTNWTEDEKAQIRDALGVDGDKTTSTGGVLQSAFAKIKLIIAILLGKV